MDWQETVPPKDGEWFFARFDNNCEFPGRAALVRWNPFEGYAWEVIEINYYKTGDITINAWPETRVFDWSPFHLPSPPERNET